MKPIDVRAITVGGEIGRRIDLTTYANFLALDLDTDFLGPFRERVLHGPQFGEGAEFYVGLGKLIDSAARLAAYTDDSRVVARKQYLVDEVLKTQDADGYIGTIPPDQRITLLWDLHEMGYLILGLVSDYRFCGQEASLAAAQRLADYYIRHWPAGHVWLANGHDIADLPAIGIDEALMALHAATGEPAYLDFVRHVRRLAERDWPLRIGRCGKVEGHAYAYLAICVAQLRLHGVQADPGCLPQTQRVLDLIARGDGMVISGAVSDFECWHDSQDGTAHLGETCATAYLVRWLDELLRARDDALYGDLMERIIYNTLFAAQSPDGRRLRYYVPFQGQREYFPTDVYCCPNNFRRAIAELPGRVFYRGSGGGLVVNLYTEGSARMDVADGVPLDVRQETGYPRSGRVLLHVDPARPAHFPLNLRIPRWCVGASVAVNGHLLARTAAPGTFVAIDRVWQAGDQVTLELPMPPRLVKGRQAQAGRVAVMRGPLVFGLNPARHPQPGQLDLRNLALDPDSLEVAVTNEPMIRARGWSFGRDYAIQPPDLDLELTEYPDPGIEAVYFKVPDPKAVAFVDDELTTPGSWPTASATSPAFR